MLITKTIIEKRLHLMEVEDYNLSLDKKTGKITHKHFKDIIDYYRSNVRLDGIKAWDVIEGMGSTLCENKDIDKDAFWETMKDFHEEVFGEHFNEPYAHWQVEQMYHTDKNGKKHHEPLFTIAEAKSVYDKHIK